MKITSSNAHVCNAAMRNWVFVRVNTDQPGLYGWGEATLEWKTRAIVGAIDDLAPLLVAADPRDIEQCFQVMTKHSFWRMGDMGSLYETSNSGDLAEPGKAVIEAGYSAVKVVCIPYCHHTSPNRDIDAVAEMMARLRAAVGSDVDIMVDFHGRPASVALARDYIAAIAPAQPLFIEEPLPPEIMAGMAHLTATAPVTIAARAFHIAQPDICHAGGLWETKKIAAMAETAGMGVAPHNPLGPIAGVAALHFGIFTPNLVIQEEMSGPVAWSSDGVSWPIDRRPGRWDLPEKPGPGIEVDKLIIAKHPFEKEILYTRNAVLAAGTVVDW